MRSGIVVAVLIAAGFGPATAQASWLTVQGSDCTVWDPSPVSNETIDWTGACKDGKAAGHGVLTIRRAGKLVERDEGEFVDGKQAGHGVRDYPNARYVGEFKDGLFDGKGLYVSSESDGMRYDGEWRDGNLDGHGALSFASGIRYEGQFRANTYTGFGRMTMANGDRYEGQYKLNTPNGKGVYTTASGSVYAGQWHHGCFRQGAEAMHLGVPAEDCGLSEGASGSSSTASAPVPTELDGQ
jgi:hypothetical protein